MKKNLSVLFLLSSMTFATSLFAANSVSNYYSAIDAQKKPTPIVAKAQYVPPTDITIINGTYDSIFAVVPSSPINDIVFSGTNDHIRHDSLYGDTRVVLQDPYHNTFFDRFVCRRAVIAIMGGPGNYRVNIDNEYCY